MPSDTKSIENNTIRILLCEDDKNLNQLLAEYLQANGFSVVRAYDGLSGLDAYRRNNIDLCLLDINMPNMNGFDLLKRIHEQDSELPAIFLSARSDKQDMLTGFRLGCDDYVTKPFSMEVLVCRILSVMRRYRSEQNKYETYHIGIYTFEPGRQTLFDGYQTVKLTTKESELLRMLCKHVNRLLDRSVALKTIWKDDNYFNARSMDVYITRLRSRLKGDPSIQITNSHGKGYTLVVPSIA